jgi:hypothetical protein
MLIYDDMSMDFHRASKMSQNSDNDADRRVSADRELAL